MKVALIYTGYLRTWEQCRPNHEENVWVDNDVNLFFYTYECPDDKTRESYIFRQWVQIPEPFYPDPWAASKYDSRKAPENTYCQTMNQWINNFTGFRTVPKDYDVYVRIRPDMKFNGRLDLKKYDYPEKRIYIPQGMDFGGINDQCAWGSYQALKTFYSVLFTYDQLWNDGTLFHSESMQLANLNRAGIEIVRVGSPQHDLIR